MGLRGGRVTAVVVALALSLAGCETTPPVAEPEVAVDPREAFAARQRLLRAASRWHATGKLGVTTADDSWSATVRWHQENDTYTIRLSGPLGQGTVELKGRPGEVQLRTAEAKVYRARDPEALMEEALGWTVPVSGMRYWLMGDIEPGKPVSRLSLDAGGRPLYLEQSGWKVSYEGYTATDSADMPLEVLMANDTLRARVILRAWEI